MAGPQISIVIGGNTAPLQQQIAIAHRLLGSLGPQLQNSVRSGSAGAGQSLVGLTAKFAALGAAVLAVGKTVQTAFGLNSNIETAALGIKGIVAALADVRDASGKLVTGPEAMTVAAGIAEDQLKKLRVQGLLTTATFQDLVKAYQASLAAGLSSGLDPDRIRSLTVSLTQAATALQVPREQLQQEMRAILSGDINQDSDMAKRLGITREDVLKWRASGADTFYDELNKRLEVFQQLGVEAAQTWSGVLSNLGDGIEVFLGKTSEGAFKQVKAALSTAFSDFFTKDGEISAAFSGLEDAATRVFDGMGAVASDVILGLVDGLKTLSAFFSENEAQTVAISAALSATWTSVKEIVGGIASIVGSTVTWLTKTGILTEAFNFMARAVALVEDTLKGLTGIFARIGASVLDNLGGPIRQVLTSVRDFVAKIPAVGEGLANAIDGALKSLPQDGAGLRAIAAGIKADFDSGNTALARTNALIAGAADNARELAKFTRQAAENNKRSGTGGTATGKRIVKADDKVAQAEQRLADADAAYARAKAESERTLLKANLDVAGALYDEALDQRLISQRQHLEAKQSIARADLQATKEAIAAEIAANEKLFAQTTDPAKKRKLEADLVSLRAKLAAIESEGVVLETTFRLNDAKLQRDIDDLRLQLKVSILDLEGNPLDAALAKLKDETDKMLRDDRVRGDAGLEAAVRREAALKEDRLYFDEYSRLAEQTRSSVARKEEAIRLKGQTGQLSSFEVEQQVYQLRQGSLTALEQQVVAAERLAATSKDPQVLANAEQLRLEYEKMKAATQSLGDTLTKTFADATVSALAGGKSIGDAFLSGFDSVFQQLLKMIQQDLASSLYSTIKGAMSAAQGSGSQSSGSGSAWGALASAIGSAFGGSGYSSGGYTGPGHWLKPAGIVHADEHVTRSTSRRSMERRYPGLLDYINRFGTLPGGYSSGGTVGAAAPAQLAIAGPSSTTVNVAPALYLNADHAAEAVMNTRGAEARVLEIVLANKRKLGL